MSASLVGSEMCIRDSLTPLPADGTKTEYRPKRAAKSNRPERIHRLPAESVSYTHLTLPTICSV
eukprot:13959992-Alexandrium_andersonii.AAC.1